MFTTNPFATLSASVSPALMQAYVIVMILLVVGGTLLDVVHKKSGRYFFDNWRRVRKGARRQVGGGEMASLAIQTAMVEGLTSGEFCNLRRRIAHLLTMYGFLAYLITTVIMVFAYATLLEPTPTILPGLWYIGALMVCVGGYWFWFFIRVDVAAEGNSRFRLVYADLFIVSLLASTTLGLIWAIVQSTGSSLWASVFLALYLIATTVLFGSIPWSKFAHMFYKPAAAYQKRIEEANGTRRNLPLPAESPATFGSARRVPQNY
jgi:hypothetical protein